MIPLRDELPSRRRPYVTIALICANVLVFFFQSSQGREFTAGLAAVPALVTGQPGIDILQPIPPALTLLTSMFLHGGLLHLGGNMLYLWIFGDNVEDVMGGFRFLLCDLLTGLAAAMAHTLMMPHSEIPMVGASGAISGVLGAYFIMFPRSRVLTLFFLFYFIQVIRVPAVFFLGLWIAWQIFYGAASLSQKGGGVAWFAHIGGFAAGVPLVFLLRKKDRLLWYRRLPR